jgi:hypothetical protein
VLLSYSQGGHNLPVYILEAHIDLTLWYIKSKIGKVDCGIIHGCDLKFNSLIRHVSDEYRSVFSWLDFQDSELISSDLINIYWADINFSLFLYNRFLRPSYVWRNIFRKVEFFPSEV